MGTWGYSGRGGGVRDQGEDCKVETQGMAALEMTITVEEVEAASECMGDCVFSDNRCWNGVRPHCDQYYPYQNLRIQPSAVRPSVLAYVSTHI